MRVGRGSKNQRLNLTPSLARSLHSKSALRFLPSASSQEAALLNSPRPHNPSIHPTTFPRLRFSPCRLRSTRLSIAPHEVLLLHYCSTTFSTVLPIPYCNLPFRSIPDLPPLLLHHSFSGV